jgi:hypothetical protein
MSDHLPPILRNPKKLVWHTAIAAAVFAGISLVWQDRDIFMGVAAGGVVATVILNWMVRAVVGVAHPAELLLRVLFQFLASAALFIMLVAWFPVLPALAGFCSLVVGCSAHAFWDLFSRSVPTHSSESL